MQKKIDSQKAILKADIKKIQGRLTFLQKSSESLDIELVKLVKQVENATVAPSFISRTNALTHKSEEQQGEH